MSGLVSGLVGEWVISLASVTDIIQDIILDQTIFRPFIEIWLCFAYLYIPSKLKFGKGGEWKVKHPLERKEIRLWTQVLEISGQIRYQLGHGDAA